MPDVSWAEQQLRAHNQRRFPDRAEPLRTPWDNDPAAPPPAIEPTRPSPSLSRRGARFRDGLPPPPPPPPPISDQEIARIMEAVGIDPTLPDAIDRYAAGVQQRHWPPLDEMRDFLRVGAARREQRLRPQAALDGGALASTAPTHPDQEALEAMIRTVEREISVVPSSALSVAERPAPATSLPSDLWGPLRPEVTPAGLTSSQKRRQRRRKLEAARSLPLIPLDVPITDSAPFGVSPMTNRTNHVQVTDPTAPVLPRACPSQVNVYLEPTQTWVAFSCSISPWPHPGQPHLIAAPPDHLQNATELFIGWYGPGE